jgi:hypothetical protein
MEQLVIHITDGKVEIEVQGAKGTRCVGLTQAIEQLIGVVRNRSVKQDFYGTTEIKHQVGIKHRTSFPPEGNR